MHHIIIAFSVAS